ncbi:hypothetical protein [Dietzia cercidiphylli]|uniref:hypothetical protein n=1 Tax=Dietzia cercidiphylli TaxID=498199 RepID=UPI00223C260E|nr:hypothetical protein [Dietzia cercidiphylli]MCT1514531.1 hypothetical protein [Dietzia cercidiphylli]
MTNFQSMDLLAAFRRQFELSRVRKGEHLVVLSEPASRPDYVEAAFGAALGLGAHVISATVPSGSPSPTPSTHTGSGAGLVSVLEDEVAQALLAKADIVVDLTREGFIHAPVQQRILGAETRIIFVCDAPDVLTRNMPSPGDKDDVLAAAEKVRGASEMTVTSAHGTDLRVDLADCHPGFQTGFADDPGRWDHWPSKMCLFWPKAPDGKLVLAPGDILLPFKEFVRSEVVLEITGGHIDAIHGGADARLLETYMNDCDDEWARYTSHMGWGLMKTADWFATAMYAKHEIMGMEARAFAGNFLWSTGPHPFLDRDSHAHLDIAMRGCTVALDGHTVVDEGALVE